jgi:hypothetical protein
VLRCERIYRISVGGKANEGFETSPCVLPPEGEGTADAYRKGRLRNGWVASMPRLAFEGLEPCDGKLSCPVLRGLGAGNSPRLPGLLEK